MSGPPSPRTLLKEHLTLARDLRKMRIRYSPQKCRGAWQCYDVCPVGCWTPNYETRVALFHNPARCIACGACVLQCPEGAIELR